MERVTKRVQSYVFLWERKLLDRFRQLRRKQPGDFFVMVHFTQDRVTLHVTSKAEKIMDNGAGDLTENS